jgi:tryptophan halogenase
VQQNNDPVFATVEYDILVDPDLYTHFFRQVARRFGVTELNETVSTTMKGAGGHIEAVRLAGGSKLDGDLFIDCSAERTIYSALDSSADVEDWSDWLKCDRLLSVLTKKLRVPELFTSTKAIAEGWLQRNTLQNFTVESLAYCSDYLDDEDAKAILETSLKHPPLSSSQLTPCAARSLRKPWQRNCVAIGRAALEIEPLCVSVLQVAQNAVLRLLSMLPANRENSALATEFNRITGEEHVGIRDFTILHYHLANRLKSPFWQAVRSAGLPAMLRKRIELFTTNGRIGIGENEWFDVHGWLSSLISFGVFPQSGDPLVDMADQAQVESRMRAFREAVRNAVTG